jgi:hypothetical protein
MGKKRIKASPIQPPAPSGVLLENLEGIVNKCKRVIEDALAVKKLRFITQRVSGNRTVCLLTGEGAKRAEAKYKYSVIPFLALQSRLYWLAASLEFVFENRMYRLLSVSLLIFEGEATDDRKSALLRAEWACLDEDTRAPHAQPHWHIYPSRINREAYEDRTEFKLKTDIQPFAPEAPVVESNNEFDIEWDRSEKFHFAMASRWHIVGFDEKGAHQEEMQIDGLLKWLDGCIRYTRSQFEFLYS